MKTFNVEVLGSISPYSKGNRNCPGFLVNYNYNKILLDCGNGITRLLNLPDDLNNMHIFISHLHKDHYGDLLSLGYATYVYHKLNLLSEKVKLYIPKIPNQDDSSYYDYLYINNMKEQYFEIITYNENSIFYIDNLKISFIRNKHDVLSFSTKLENNNKKLIYTGDTGYETSKQLITFASKADLLISEATFLRSDNKVSDNHLHAYQSAEIAKYTEVKKLLLTHLWPEHNPIEYLMEARPIFNNTEIAKEQKILQL